MIPIARLAKVQQLLESRLEEVFALVTSFQARIRERQRGRLAALSREEIREDLSEKLCPDIYKRMVVTLAEALPLAQPDSAACSDWIDLYLWPGYHSCLADGRIFIRFHDADGEWNFGAGVRRNASTGEVRWYHDCSQARWYHFLVRPRNGTRLSPGNIHEWYRLQQPSTRANPRCPVASLTVTTQPVDARQWEPFPNHQLLHLTAGRDESETWGEKLSEKVNSLGFVRDECWRFPGKRDEQPDDAQRQAAHRNRMASVWLHAALGDGSPAWLERFARELEANDRTRGAGRALHAGLEHTVARTWGDDPSGRARYRCWTYLGPHRSSAPVSPAMFSLAPAAETTSTDPDIVQTVGSVALLSSVPLEPVFLALAHPWASAVYGMMRDAEIAILLHNHQIEAATSTGLLAGRWFADELKKHIDVGLRALLREATDASAEALENRYFVLNSIRTLGDLAYAYASGMLSADREPLHVRQTTFLQPLRALRDRGELVGALRHVAAQVYRMTVADPVTCIRFPPAPDSPPGRLSDDEHRYCLLLVADAVRTYCHSAGDSCVGDWSAELIDDVVSVRLAGRTCSERSPASMGFVQLDRFLRNLQVGSASVAWNDVDQTCCFTVTVSVA